VSRRIAAAPVLAAIGLALTSCAGSPPVTSAPRSSYDASVAANDQAVAGASPDWPTYHRNNARTGYDVTTPKPTTLTERWRAALDQKVYAEPIVIGTTVIVATENNTVYAFDATSGAQLWKRHVASPVPVSALPCGNIDPLGITGTPAYDSVTKRVFVVAEQPGVVHRLYGINIATGVVEVSRSVDPPNQDPTPMQQRGALLVTNGRVYVTYGGLYGDCGDYHGHVVSLPTSGVGSMQFWRVPTPREGGIWAPAGATLSFDGQSLYVSVGNGESKTVYDGSDSVVKLSLALNRMDWFAPTTWRTDNAIDLDLGSMSPATLPNNRILIAGKSGSGYLLDASDLGHLNGQIKQKRLCTAFGGSARVGQVVYVPCTDGVRAVTVTDTDFTVSWKAVDNISGSPVVGMGGAVFSLDPTGGTLYVLDANNGNVITSRSVGTTTRFATPTLWKTTIFVGTEADLVALKAS
jgi:outer membrane protein assembly factor BamB